VVGGVTSFTTFTTAAPLHLAQCRARPGTGFGFARGNESSGFGVQLSLLGTAAPAGSDATMMEVFHIESGGKSFFVNDVSINGERGGMVIGSAPGYYSDIYHNLYYGGSPATWRNTSQGPASGSQSPAR